MNILFLLKTLETGGVEIVTATLANFFTRKGHNVCIFSFMNTENGSVKDRISPAVHIYTQHSLTCNKENIHALRQVMHKEQTQIVINQWGLPYFLLKTGNKAAQGMNVKFISVYHNTPDMNGRLQGIDNKLDVTNNPLKRTILKAMRYAFKQITAHSMRWCYNHSDRYMVLSPSFVEKFINYTGIKDSSKLIVQTNPITIDASDFAYIPSAKEKEIVFVGRLDFYQKKVNRVIDTWALLENQFPDWKLTIIGDGPDRINIEKQVHDLKLQRVSFEGFQNPIEYYKRASMLILTSEFEGFPLVLAEAMSFGVVPVVYNSYAAAGDIVRSGINGLLIPYNKDGFKAEIMAEGMKRIMKSSNTLHTMAVKAIDTSTEYSIDTIYNQWMKIISNLNN